MDTFTVSRDKSRWKWTLMNLVPDWVPDAFVDRARAGAPDAPLLDRLRVETLSEGRCVQTLHIGTYDDEAPVLARMHDEFIPARGLRMTGRHHEIYFSDPRRTDPSKLKTLLRQPVARSEEHTSELQSLMRNSYAVFCLKKKKYPAQQT